MEIYAVYLDFKKKLDSPDFPFTRLLAHVESGKAVRLRKFWRDEDKLRGLYGDLLVRRAIIKHISGLSNRLIRFDVNDFGKPYLIGHPGFHFNISHSGDWVVGVIDDKPVGIDVEEVQSIDLEISENYYSNDEHADLMSKEDKFDYFFTLWALKESYIKILGKGLSHPLNAFSIQFTEPRNTETEPVLFVDNKRIPDIFFRQFDLNPLQEERNPGKRYKMAVCASHDRIPVEFSVVTAAELNRFFLQ